MSTEDQSAHAVDVVIAYFSPTAPAEEVEPARQELKNLDDALICGVAAIGDQQRLKALADKRDMTFEQAQSHLRLIQKSLYFCQPDDNPILIRENVQPLRVMLEAFRLAPEENEFYLEGFVDTIMPKKDVTLMVDGDQGRYSTILFQRNIGRFNRHDPDPVLQLRFRTRIPIQGFSFSAQMGDLTVPVALEISPNDDLAPWHTPFAFEELADSGVLVPTPTGFDLVHDKMWLAKRRLLRIRHRQSAKGVNTLHFWDKDEEREARTQKWKNQNILGCADEPASPRRVNLDSWRPAPGGANLGDYLSRVVVEWMLSKRGLSLDDPVPETRFLAAVGSILNIGCNDSTVWGSGLLWGKCPHFVTPASKSLDIRALRGPETKRLLEARGYVCPDVFGDPAVLMPLIYQPSSPAEKNPSLVIAHMFDQSESDLDIMTTDYQGFIDQLVQAERVISSSLHGIILAEAYGVPAILLDDYRPDFSLHKYRDWYYSTGRTEFPVARTVEEARAMTPAPLPDLANMQQRLMEAFPYDLWEQ